MMDKSYKIIACIVFLTACTTNQPESTATLPFTVTPVSLTATPIAPTTTPPPTSTPTETPVLLSDLTGSLFFDYNGSGLWDEGEPAISGLTVCVVRPLEGDVCVETDNDGNLLFEALAPSGEKLALKFEDPNADDPSLAFRYINVWHGLAVIEAYELNGVQLPEQHLNDTEVMPSSQSVNVSVGEKIILGLMQGFFTYPFPKNSEIYIWTWYDVDERNGYVQNWVGDSSQVTPYDNSLKLFDNHYGIDWLVGEHTIFLAPAPGIIREIHIDTDPNSVQNDTMITIEHPGTSLYTHFGHIDFSTLTVEVGDYVFRGQQISNLVKAPYGPGEYPLPYMLHGQIQCCLNIDFPLVQSQIFDFYSFKTNFSFWTKYNDPIFP